jgi:hypothetical protein
MRMRENISTINEIIKKSIASQSGLIKEMGFCRCSFLISTDGDIGRG